MSVLKVSFRQLKILLACLCFGLNAQSSVQGNPSIVQKIGSPTPMILGVGAVIAYLAVLNYRGFVAGKKKSQSNSKHLYFHILSFVGFLLYMCVYTYQRFASIENITDNLITICGFLAIVLSLVRVAGLDSSKL